MKTMNDLYGDGSNHEACEKCGKCITCNDCKCEEEVNTLNKIREFLENYDLGWHDECYTIAKKTIKDVEEDIQIDKMIKQDDIKST